ncbi:MAG: ATP-binding protein [Bacteroidota bacterium]
MEPRVILFGTAVILVLTFGIISFVLIYLRRQQQQQLEMSRLNELHQRNLLEASVDSQEHVRRQIGGDLHDEIGTLLSASKMSLSVLGKNIAGQAEAKILIDQTADLINQAVSNVRRISKDLMPSTLDEFGLVIALEELSEKLTVYTGIPIFFKKINVFNQSIPKKIELIYYRIVQELINNSLKHANPTEINIYLELRQKHLVLTVFDDGIGFDMNEVLTNPKNGIGIRNIQSRLSLVDGKVDYEVAKGKGAKITIDVQLDSLPHL